MSSEERGRSSYLDLLITTLMEHEKNLDTLIGRIEKIYEELQSIYEKANSKPKEAIFLKRDSDSSTSEQDTLIYMKVKLDRYSSNIIEIIKALNE